MSLVHRCMIIPAALQAQCQSLPEASGMWTAGLSLDGSVPATHYISSGLVDQAFDDLLRSQEELIVGIDMSEDDPHCAMNRLGLKLTNIE